MSEIKKRVDNRIDVELQGQPVNIRMLLPAIDLVFLGLGSLLLISGIGVYIGQQGIIPSASLAGIGLILLALAGISTLKFGISVSKNRSILFKPVQEKIMETTGVKLTSAQIAAMWSHEEVETDKYRMRFENRQGAKFKVGIYPVKNKQKA